ncbi:MAG: hypothetical protein ABW182_13535 [Sphingomonas sp.]
MALVSCAGRTASAQDAACPYLPQFETLRSTVENEPPLQSLPRLYAYLADPANENPAACEPFEIERLIGEREIAMVTLAVEGRAPLHPDRAYHCDRIDPRTTRCDGMVADDTGHSDQLPKAGPISGRFVGSIRTTLPGTRLIGVYRARLGDNFNARPAIRLDPRRPVSMTARPGDVLIAVFTAPAPFKLRKLVWYF